jgi:polyvinyl alcohol dehydrogenase (cytochrome)
VTRSVRTSALLLGLALSGTLWAAPAGNPAPQDSSSSALKDVSELSANKSAVDPETLPGAPLYHRICANCHEGQVAKAPHKMFLQMMPAKNIVTALTTGVMREQGAALSSEERQRVAEYLAGAPLSSVAPPAPPRCTARAAQFDLKHRPAAVGWGLDNSGFTPSALAGLTGKDLGGLKLKWALEFPGAMRARSQPAVAYGAVYVGSQDGTVYALDLATGCVRWTFQGAAEVRTAIVMQPDASVAAPARLFFGDVIAHAYAVDALTGTLLWSVKIDEHPNATVTGTPAYHAGVLYVPVSSLEVTSAADPKYECCKFRGAVVALEAASGTVRWKAYTVAQEPRVVRTTAQGTRVFAPSGAPVWGSPTVDAARGLLYLGTGDNYSSPADDSSDAVMALHLQDGARAWSRQLSHGDAWNVACMMEKNPNCPEENGPDVDVAASIIPYRTASGRQVLLVGQKNGVVYGLDADAAGAVLWKQRVGRGGIQGGIEFGMAGEGGELFVPIADLADGHDGRRYDSPPRPGLYALDAESGAARWSAPAADVCAGRKFCDPGIVAAVTAIPGVVFAGHMDGWLRAYDTQTGKLLWQYDATQPVRTVSGTSAHGGSFGGPGPVVRDGYLIATSGYGLYFHMPGNVLLVFAKGR